MASDFDEGNIKQGLDEIDQEMNAIEDQRPAENDDQWDDEINDLISANAALR